MSTRVAIAIGVSLLLSSCSYFYRIVATFEGGRIVFLPRQEGWSIFRPKLCFNALAVYSSDPSAGGVAPPAGNWLGGDSSPLVWSFQSARRGTNACIGEFPVRYGEAPHGAHVTVPPRRLRPDITYEIHATGPGIDGAGSFKLERTVRIENLAGNNAHATH